MIVGIVGSIWGKESDKRRISNSIKYSLSLLGKRPRECREIVP